MAKSVKGTANAHPVARGDGLDEQQADDGGRAGEAHQHQGEGHQEDGQQPRRIAGLGIYGVGPAVGQLDFKPTEEAYRENHEQKEDENVEDGVGGEGVERARTEDGSHQKAQSEVDDDNTDTVGDGVSDSLSLVVFGAFEEETHRHGDDGPDAGHDEGQQTADESHEENVEKAVAGQVVAAAQLLQLLDDGLPKGVLVRVGEHGSGRRVGLGKAVGTLRGQGFALLFGSGCRLGCCRRGVVGRCHSLRGGLCVLARFAFGDGGRLAALVEVDGRRRHAVLVVAGTVFQVAFYLVIGFRELDFLHKLHAAFKVAQLHVEERVVCRDFLAARCQLADQFDALELAHVERGRGGPTVGNIGGIDVPTGLDLAREDDFGVGAAIGFEL